jgi:Flp pilus assembly protein TadD
MSRRHHTGFSSIALLAALATSGCAVMPDRGADRAEAVTGQSDTFGMDPIAEAAYWGTRYDRAPTDPKVAVSYSKALRTVENNQESLRVIRHASLRIGEHADVSLELGKSLIANDRPHEAVRPIERAIALGKSDDWAAYSAYGVALDRIGEHRKAREQYDRALALAPNNAHVLNNKGLSYALQGKRDMAEQTLRVATATPGGTAKVRQNLALVLALSGKADEAERLARSDLPPSVADGNAAYFRQLVAQPAYWTDLSAADAELPDFGDDPGTISFTTRSEPVPEPHPSPTPHRIKKPAPAPAPVPSFKAPEPVEGKPAPGTSAKAEDETQPRLAANAAPTALTYDGAAD